MNRYSCQFVIYILTVYVEIVRAQNYVGDRCTVEKTGESAVCRLLQDCQSAITALQKRVYPQTCGFQSNQPIVCCAGEAANVAIPLKIPTPAKPSVTAPKAPVPSAILPKPTNTTVRPSKPASKRVGDKANQKCKEYGEFVYVKESPPVNLPGSKPYLRSDCGIVEVPLIVGGEDAKPKEFPHMALLGYVGQDNTKMWLCGGSLISDEYVLTAGHCLYDKNHGEPKYIRLGDLVISKTSDDAKPQEMNIRRAIKHPEYKRPSQYNDIALIQLAKKVVLNSYVRPICLYTQKSLSTKQAIASGWGQLGYTADTSDKLMKVTLEYFSNDECNTTYKSNIGGRLQYGIVPETQICAGSHSAKKDTCQGDSGGPLQIYNGKQVYCTYKLVGVTSFGRSCGIVPGVYTLVSSYIEWIENTVWS